ncbi:hypothetical protein [uncultured Tateyamaria sp.]|uniref:hypothetical protein n=1 Tax=uncultured Tateyamaria sp. TaxID=455651 RepID=UPI0026029F50|nr:hypothetical protein [uncultured Tateyamaria sp.]
MKEKVAGKKLRERDYYSEESQHLVDIADFRKFPILDLISKIEIKLNQLEKRTNRKYIFGFVTLAILFASMNGVEIEISIIGLKLSGVADLKEFTVLGLAAIGLIFYNDDDDKMMLQELRKNLLKKKYGDDLYNIYSLAIMPEATDRPAAMTGYGERLMVGEFASKLAEWRSFAALSTVALVMIGLCYMYAFILSNIWLEPNWSFFWARSLVIFAGLMFALEMVDGIIFSNMKLVYVDRGKWNEFPLLDENGDLTEKAKNMLRELSS